MLLLSTLLLRSNFQRAPSKDLNRGLNKVRLNTVNLLLLRLRKKMLVISSGPRKTCKLKIKKKSKRRMRSRCHHQLVLLQLDHRASKMLPNLALPSRLQQKLFLQYPNPKYLKSSMLRPFERNLTRVLRSLGVHLAHLVPGAYLLSLHQQDNQSSKSRHLPQPREWLRRL